VHQFFSFGFIIAALQALAEKGIPVCPDVFSAGGAGIVR
jgi:hypothetical protein